jgi:hypothetical protein
VDFDISQGTEADVEAVLQHLTARNARMLEILRRVARARERRSR